jgi:hypothetical protein
LSLSIARYRSFWITQLFHTDLKNSPLTVRNRSHANVPNFTFVSWFPLFPGFIKSRTIISHQVSQLPKTARMDIQEQRAACAIRGRNLQTTMAGRRGINTEEYMRSVAGKRCGGERGLGFLGLKRLCRLRAGKDDVLRHDLSMVFRISK